MNRIAAEIAGWYAFSRIKEEGRMDKISAVLILGIIVLAMTSGIIVYDTWIADEMQGMEPEIIVQNTAAEEELTFNEDTSIKNNSQRELWIRVKPVYDSSYDAEEYEIVSGAVNSGLWQPGGESWYYYAKPVGFAQSTEPLIDILLYNGEKVPQSGAGRFSLQVEALDEEWFVSRPADGMEAFEIFKETMAIPDRACL